MTSAKNRYAWTKRGYYMDGLVQTDSQFIAKYGDGTESDAMPANSDYIHEFGLYYRYDLNGRRTSMDHPWEHKVGHSATRYYYSWGPVDSIFTDAYNTYRFRYRADGQLARYEYPPGGQEVYSYDLDGRLHQRTSNLGSLALRNDVLTYDKRGKIVRAVASAGEGAGEEYRHLYAGLGGLAATRWGSLTQSGARIEEFEVDGLGNVWWSRNLHPVNGDRRGTHSMLLRGESTASYDHQIYSPTTPANADTVYHTRNQAGNTTYSGQRTYSYQTGTSEIQRARFVNHYYGTDDKLASVHLQDVFIGTGVQKVTEEYRYDALGRRVLVRSRQEGYCAYGCVSAIQRFVWDGDQIFYEFRRSGSGTSGLDGLTGSGRQYGRVSYDHGPGIDRPLGIIRSYYSNGAGSRNPFLVVPHANWRGMYDSGTDGYAKIACPGGNWSSCIAIDWPGKRLSAYMGPQGSPPFASNSDWFGSLLAEKADQSGLLYMRNRYYDPVLGKFTQEDPIGLAGGLNVFGYANGDPITYSDPFGLNPWKWIDVALRAGLLFASMSDTEQTTDFTREQLVTDARNAGGARTVEPTTSEETNRQFNGRRGRPQRVPDQRGGFRLPRSAPRTARIIQAGKVLPVIGYGLMLYDMVQTYNAWQESAAELQRLRSTTE